MKSLARVTLCAGSQRVAMTTPEPSSGDGPGVPRGRRSPAANSIPKLRLVVAMRRKWRRKLLKSLKTDAIMAIR
jgi:hypothetical protein